MSIVDKTTLKSYFEPGDVPTAAEFENLIDSTRQDQKLHFNASTRQLSIETTEPGAAPYVNSVNLSSLNQQTLSYDSGSNSLSISGVAGSVPLGNVGLWTDGGSNIHKTTGNVGIGTSNPSSKLHVNGSFRLQSGPDITGISTATSLGLSDDIIPTQKAVKNYVDTRSIENLFYAYEDSSPTVSVPTSYGAPDVKVPMYAVYYNPNTDYDRSNYVFTAPQDGIYYFSVTLHLVKPSSNALGMLIYLLKPSATVTTYSQASSSNEMNRIRMLSSDTAKNTGYVHGNAEFSLNAGDTVELRCRFTQLYHGLEFANMHSSYSCKRLPYTVVGAATSLPSNVL